MYSQAWSWGASGLQPREMVRAWIRAQTRSGGGGKGVSGPQGVGVGIQGWGGEEGPDLERYVKAKDGGGPSSSPSADLKPSRSSNWQPGEPNDAGQGEHCVMMQASGQWNDAFCGSYLDWVCERLATC